MLTFKLTLLWYFGNILVKILLNYIKMDIFRKGFVKMSKMEFIDPLDAEKI